VNYGWYLIKLGEILYEVHQGDRCLEENKMWGSTYHIIIIYFDILKILELLML
jgi:hypothetical protein